MNKDLNDARAKDADSVDGDLTMAIPYHYKHPLPPPATPTATTIATLSMVSVTTMISMWRCGW